MYTKVAEQKVAENEDRQENLVMNTKELEQKVSENGERQEDLLRLLLWQRKQNKNVGWGIQPNTGRKGRQKVNQTMKKKIKDLIDKQRGAKTKQDGFESIEIVRKEQFDSW